MGAALAAREAASGNTPSAPALAAQ